MENKTTVLLRTHADWNEWIELVKTAAYELNIDPAGAHIALTEPIRPTPNDIKPSSTRHLTSFSALTPDEAEEYRDQQRHYQRQLKRYDRRILAIATIRMKIQETVARENLHVRLADERWDIER